MIRTVLGDRQTMAETATGTVYAHEHLIIDSPLIADRFSHIHLDSADSAVAEVQPCGDAGARLMLDAMPCSAGRDAVRLADISRRTGVDIVAATGLHHDRYYGSAHWTNRVSVQHLVDLFVADLVDGIDAYDYTGPIVQRTPHRAGVVKVATSGPMLDDRDRRVLDAAAQASVATGAPVLTHCEGGLGALEQVEALAAAGVPAGAIMTSHVDKPGDLEYLCKIAATGATVECDQALRQHADGDRSTAIDLIVGLCERGFADSISVGTDGARRSLWTSLGGGPGLAWLATTLPTHLRTRGLSPSDIEKVMGGNAARALSWRPPGSLTGG